MNLFDVSTLAMAFLACGIVLALVEIRNARVALTRARTERPGQLD